MFKNILLPLDGSDLAEVALPTAVSLAKAMDCRIVLCHVLPDITQVQPEMALAGGHALAISKFRTSYEGWITDYLDKICAQLEADGVRCTHKIEKGHIAQKILAIAQQDIDMIVMNSHGYSGLSRWMLGSVSERVINHANCPVLVVKGTRPIKKVLVPLDGSTFSEVAIEPALEIAAGVGGDVTFLNILEPLNDVPNALVARLGQLDPEWDAWVKGRNHDRARAYVQDLAKSYSVEANVPVDAVLKKDEPAEGILEHVGETAVDLIVMSTHGRSGISKWLLGSVTTKVLQQLPTHLLVIRPLL